MVHFDCDGQRFYAEQEGLECRHQTRTADSSYPDLAVTEKEPCARRECLTNRARVRMLPTTQRTR